MTSHTPSNEQDASAIVAAAAARRAPLSLVGGGTKADIGRPAQTAATMSCAAPRSFASSASRSSSWSSTSRDLRIRIAVCLFEVCERSFWHWTTMPVGRVRDPDRRVGLVHVLAACA